jgi:hypothetical protein
MFEHDAALRTWAIECAPDSTGPQPAERLDDHRLAYLEYEGPVSRDRGTVVRWDEGMYHITREDQSLLELQLYGAKLVGSATLKRVGSAASPQSWTYDYSPLRSR